MMFPRGFKYKILMKRQHQHAVTLNVCVSSSQCLSILAILANTFALTVISDEKCQSFYFCHCSSDNFTNDWSYAFVAGPSKAVLLISKMFPLLTTLAVLGNTFVITVVSDEKCQSFYLCHCFIG